MLRCLVFLLALAGTAARAEPTVYSVGVTPQFDQRRLFTIWKPVLDTLKERTGATFRFESTFSVPEFERNVARGAYDFVYVNPYHLHRERTRQGYIPLVRDRTPLRGIVVVRKDSPIRSIKDLDTRSLAVPSPNAFGASMLIRAELERRHGVHMTLQNAKSHSSAYLYAVNRLADAAGGVDKTLAEQAPAVRDALRVVFTTPDFPSHPVSAHPRVPSELRDKVRRALLDLAATPEGQQLLEGIPMSRPIPASFKDYEVLQQLGIDAYWNEPVPDGKP